MTTAYAGASLAVLAPSIVLVLGGVGCLLLEVSRPGARRRANAFALAVTALSAACLYLVGRTTLDPAVNPLASEVGTDLLALGLAPAFYLATAAALVLSGPYLRETGRNRAEFQGLVLFSAAGMVLLAQARDLLVLFLALETLSIPLYVLTGFFTDRERSVEAALKYFTVGAFSSAFVAFGLALTYGAAGTLSLSGVREALAAAVVAGDGGRLVLAHGGLAFLIVGFGFKIALVPFHAWAADVYQGSPTPITAFLSVGSKAAGLAGLLRVLVEVFPPLPGWEPVLAVLAALTLIVGNCVAMLQEDIKRLLAYSGISHVGFILMAVVANQRLGSAANGGMAEPGSSPALVAVLFYFLAYSLMTLGAIAVVTVLEREYGHGTLILDYAGLAARRPRLAAAMLVFMLSLGGMPPTAGFLGKWLVFRAVMSAGLGWLAVVAAITSVVAFYYYLRVVLQMYLRPAREGGELAAPGTGRWVLIAGAMAGTLLLGIVPWVFAALLPVPAGSP